MEIQALKRLAPHPNIINLVEVLFDQLTGRLGMVFELMDKSLYDLICGRQDHLDTQVTTHLAAQLFTGLEHMHNCGIFHRDIKPENILVDETARRLKLADFGSCRGTKSKQPYTGYVATRWYRAPECFLTYGHYGSEMDIWGAGSVLFELISLYPLFPGADEVDQLNRIHKVIGTPPSTVLTKMKLKNSFKSEFRFPTEKGVGIRHFIPHASSCCVNFLNQTLVYDYTMRISAKEALRHAYFNDLISNLTHEPDFISEADSSRKSKRSERKKVNVKGTHTQFFVKKVTQGLPSDRERKPKRNNTLQHMKEKRNISHKFKKVKPTEDKGSEASKAAKPTRQHRPAVPNTKLPSMNASRHKNKNTTDKKNDDSINHAQQVHPKRNKRFANVKSSGYGSTYRPSNSAGAHSNSTAGVSRSSRCHLH